MNKSNKLTRLINLTYFYFLCTKISNKNNASAKC